MKQAAEFAFEVGTDIRSPIIRSPISNQDDRLCVRQLLSRPVPVPQEELIWLDLPLTHLRVTGWSPTSPPSPKSKLELSLTPPPRLQVKLRLDLFAALADPAPAGFAGTA